MDKSSSQDSSPKNSLAAGQQPLKNIRLNLVCCMSSADSFEMSVAISVDPYQTAPVGVHTVCLFAEISP